MQAVFGWIHNRILPDQCDELAQSAVEIIPHLRNDRIIPRGAVVRSWPEEVSVLEEPYDQRIALQPARLVEVRREEAVLALGDRVLEAGSLLLEVARVGLLVQAGLDDDHIRLELGQVALRPCHLLADRPDDGTGVEGLGLRSGILAKLLLKPGRPGLVGLQVEAEGSRTAIGDDADRIRRLGLEYVFLVAEAVIVGLGIRVVAVQ